MNSYVLADLEKALDAIDKAENMALKNLSTGKGMGAISAQLTIAKSYANIARLTLQRQDKRQAERYHREQAATALTEVF